MRRAAPALVLLLLAPLSAGEVADDPVARGLAYLREGQNDDGSFDAYATNVVEAASAAGLDARQWPRAEASALGALAPYGHDAAAVYYSHLRIAYAAAAAGYDPRDVHGTDHVQRVRDGHTGAQSGSPTYVNDDAWAILALRAAGEPATDPQVRDGVAVLRAAQRVDGGWSYLAADVSGWTDVTGMALAALKAAGEDMEAYANARAFLDATRTASGGHADKPGGASANCQSTAWALHGYAALGVEPPEGSLDFLRGLQRAGGGFAVADGVKSPNAFCTAEALVVLAGARHPLPAFAPAQLRIPPAHAGEPATLRVAPPHTALEVAWRDARVAGGATFTAPAAGVHAFDFRATGPGVHARGSGSVAVASARPVVGGFPTEVVVHRPAPLALDLAGAYDPDGSIARFEIDWGDGNASSEPRHAYERPGTYRVVVRAQDDAGVWSRNATFTAIVPNRAPTLAPLPERVVGDRVTGATLRVEATDPDGDALHGTGDRTFVLGTLGEHTVEVVVEDAYGGVARANVTADIVNLPPRVALRVPQNVTADAEVTLEADAHDPDGPPPALAWSAGPRARFAPGPQTVRVVATDADGARATATATFVVGEPAPEAPPAVRDLDASLAEGVLSVRFEAAGDAIVRWQSDAGSGERAQAESPLAIDLPGATWASVTIEAIRGGARAWAESGIVVATGHAQAQEKAPGEADGRTRAQPASSAPVVVRAAPPPQEAPHEDAALAPAAVLTSQPDRETPAPAWWAPLPLALLARRGKRAR